MLLAFCPWLSAAEPTLQSSARIDASGQGYNGNFGVNQAAGASHKQANSRAIAIGIQGNASTRVQQTLGGRPAPSVVGAQARITGSSFSHGNGVLGINQSAGAANQHSNALSISVGGAPESLDDSVLSQNAARTSVSGSAASDSGARVVEVDDSAFAGSRGVVQLNQSAGVGNRTANSLSIRIEQ